MFDDDVCPDPYEARRMGRAEAQRRWMPQPQYDRFQCEEAQSAYERGFREGKAAQQRAREEEEEGY
jgi:hypothetical protein